MSDHHDPVGFAIALGTIGFACLVFIVGIAKMALDVYRRKDIHATDQNSTD